MLWFKFVFGLKFFNLQFPLFQIMIMKNRKILNASHAFATNEFVLKTNNIIQTTNIYDWIN